MDPSNVLMKRKVGGVRVARTTTRNSQTTNQDKYTIQYFQQLIDIETVCENALRSLRLEVEENNDILQKVQEEQWKNQFDIPIFTKY
ncbi:hypothetical protein TVAG_026420 [Trichomonas vaginalis G3]|uniref:Uncharacterized protein n=1 Tax=Trichomonas vaginalis (strain ATCC PRA-98 / G3) TaxID=412133 RepID=A2DZ45_TRIV3|nr:hypothetical protein TVAGG3_0504910 [Trichomonas vaginalis G3]EAY14321.1 hypothetical protein TVAG_026420 [Trichomonas vaginalis G3]KAI5517348.1 hypothetical protein TVAGG3_0504910 [Trichomonas vaginalis G3]|eukprot:XP_001326544.1 hypothetical protein [Trichomonas vaginalis G3]